MKVEYREVLVLLAAAVAFAAQASEARYHKTNINTIPEQNKYEVIEDYEKSYCPRDCVCVDIKDVKQEYSTATCNRLNHSQKFGDNITDIVFENIDSHYPISLGDGIFMKLGLRKIMTIKIVNSTIKEVSPTAYRELHELFAVTMTANRLISLHPETFAYNYNKLIFLTLSYNPLKFPAKGSSEYFLNSSSVLQLDISNCNMSYITSNMFSQLRSIMYLNLAGNALSSIDADAFRSLSELNELNLRDNNIMKLPGDLFLGNENLYFLQIQGNPIESLDGLEISDITTLNAGQMRIKSIGPSMFNGMDYMTNLNLSGNGIESIHDQAFHKLVNLNFLDLSYNNLDFISPLLVEQNVELDIFNISNNARLKQLPTNGFTCSVKQFSVYLFDASNCGLREISDNALSTFAALKQINLSGNQLERIGDNAFTHCTELVEVDLENNFITNFGRESFAKNKELSKLSIRNNPLKYLSPEMFMYIPKLKWLDMSHTGLLSLGDEKGSPHTLLKNLIFLNISNNYMAQIKQTEIEPMENLAVLDISNNALMCNREFVNLITWLNKHNISSNYAVKESLITKEDLMEEKSYIWEPLIREICKDDIIKTYIF